MGNLIMGLLRKECSLLQKYLSNSVQQKEFTKKWSVAAVDPGVLVLNISLYLSKMFVPSFIDSANGKFEMLLEALYPCRPRLCSQPLLHWKCVQLQLTALGQWTTSIILYTWSNCILLCSFVNDLEYVTIQIFRMALISIHMNRILCDSKPGKLKPPVKDFSQVCRHLFGEALDKFPKDIGQSLPQRPLSN